MSTRKARCLRLLVVLSLLTGLVSMSSAAFADVDPPSVEAELPRGGSMQVEKTVTTPAIPAIVDICLLEDETGSFGDDIVNLQLAAPDLYDTIVATAPDAQFAVAGFRDFPVAPFGDPSDWVYRLLQPMDPDKADWLAGVAALTAGGGADTPEAQFNAMAAAAGPGLFMDPTLGEQGDCGWRDIPGVQRVLVVATDAPFHTPTSAALYIDYATTLAAIQAQGIKVIGLKAPGAGSELDQFAADTGGSVQPLSSDGANIAQAILDALEEIRTDVWWEASCDAGLGVTLDPAVHYDVPGSTAVNFTETITVAPDAPGGYLSCTVTFIANSYPEEGAPIGTQSIRIKVTPTCPLDAAVDLEKLVNGEDADEPDGPVVPVGSEVTYTYVVTNNGLVPLIGIIVADDKLGTICKIPTLAPGESYECKKTATALEGPHANRAKAGGSCIAPNGRKNAVKDIDYGHYLGVPIVDVCMVDNYGFFWDLDWNVVTGELLGPVSVGAPWTWDGSGAVTPPDLFDTTAASTVGLTAVNPNADGCASGYTDYFVYTGARVPGTNDWSGSWISYCSGSPAGSGAWTGTFSEVCEVRTAPSGSGPANVQ
jgi:hypothetical protein